jgi:decaprenyl-phosphate phosphoribosyltransferase
MIKVLESIFVASRPKHWIKNLLVFALPLSDGLLIGNAVRGEAFLRGFYFFFALSLISSGNYLINDILDKNVDVLHPKKSKRPIASGKLSINLAIIVAIAVILLPIALTFILFDAFTSLMLSLFALLQLSYSTFFKSKPAFDVVLLSMLYVGRSLFPALYENIAVSQWFLMIFFSAALFLSFGKRFAEMRNQPDDAHRKVLLTYSEIQLQIWIAISLSVLVMSYANWIFSLSDTQGFALILLSVIPMSILLIRMSGFALSKYGEDPTKFIFKSPIDIGILSIWLFLYLLGKGYL